MVEAATVTDTRKQAIFARHETFHPRFGWLKKGFKSAVHDPGVFLEEDAPVQLGVGKNMVRAIRYWCAAFKLLENDCPTEFGTQLLGENGYDPYLEDPASLWLLHWKMLESPCQATAWDFTFNHFRAIEFETEQLLQQLGGYRDRESPRTVDASLSKDISCLLRMYTEQPAKAKFGEESLDCPFAQLGLIHKAAGSRSYTFRVGYKSTLPAELVVYACLQFAHKISDTARTIPIAKLLYDQGSPGLIFKLNESALSEAIEKVARHQKKVTISDAAGKLQLAFDDLPLKLADKILENYYKAFG
jgi:Protein of unknown function (DUF4007)